MKPLGPIPAGYAAKDGQLAIGGFTARELVVQAGGTPLFVYSRQMLDSRMAELRAAMPERLAIHYAVKANPWHPVIEHMKGLADGFDIASGGELTKVLDSDIDPSLVSFAGPGKRDAELEAAIAARVTINLESAAEAERAIAIGDRLQLRPRLAVRVNECPWSRCDRRRRQTPRRRPACWYPACMRRARPGGARPHVRCRGGPVRPSRQERADL